MIAARWDHSEWKASLLCCGSTIYHQLMMPFPKDSIAQPAVGFFGGTDIALHRGPIKGGMSPTAITQSFRQLDRLSASLRHDFAHTVPLAPVITQLLDRRFPGIV